MPTYGLSAMGASVVMSGAWPSATGVAGHVPV